jgi:hypothetical protein
MKPSIGRIVHYRLDERDAGEINARRGGSAIHSGNRVEEGDTFPAMIVRTWGNDPGSAVQLQVFLDGNDQHWVTSVVPGTGPRTYSWPQAVQPVGVAYGDRI